MASKETLNLFDKIYYETYADILKYVVLNCSNIDDVKDIVQIIYLAVLKNIQKNKDVNRKYVFGIANKKIKDYYRFKYRYKIESLFSKKDELSLVDKIPADIDIEADVITKDDIDKIWEFLKREKVIISKIFYLYYYADTSLKEIATILNISESSVKNYLYRTIKKINNYLAKEDD